ncbi:OmpA family protein [Telmatospirillum siberiense]|nr:OmpA family protein [Telmatospirillum siberiense]
MTLGRYMLMAGAGFALSACVIAGGGSPPTVDAQGTPDLNKFEVFFDPDRSEISETAAKILYEVADSAKENPAAQVKLSVHSVAAGWDANSQALSERRAEAVKAELIKDGVPPSRISSVDIGTAQLTPTDDGVREPQNRRTEVTLYLR